MQFPNLGSAPVLRIPTLPKKPDSFSPLLLDDGKEYLGTAFPVSMTSHSKSLLLCQSRYFCLTLRESSWIYHWEICGTMAYWTVYHRVRRSGSTSIQEHTRSKRGRCHHSIHQSRHVLANMNFLKVTSLTHTQWGSLVDGAFMGGCHSRLGFIAPEHQYTYAGHRIATDVFVSVTIPSWLFRKNRILHYITNCYDRVQLQVINTPVPRD